jgi:glycosyltransferase involved in cell wall biosynthesis
VNVAEFMERCLPCRGWARVLVDDEWVAEYLSERGYDVTPDGRRLAIAMPDALPAPPPDPSAAHTYSIVIPTGHRERYLDLALADLAAQAFPAERYEILVVDDTEDGANRELAERHGVRYVRTEGGRGINAARNTGIRRSTGDVVVYVDDDCRFDRGWLAALAGGVDAAPRAECFGGPIEQWIEPGHPRWCKRDEFPVTTLDHGTRDRWVDLVFGANFAVRRTAFERVGPFVQEMSGPGDEVEWILRLRRNGGLVRYVAGAGVTHTRFADDVTVKKLFRASLAKARHTAAFDREHGISEPMSRVLNRALRQSAHAVVYRCWSAAAHALQSYAYAFHTLRG